MPQLEQINTYLGQVFWLVVTFGLLYLILWRSALPRISRVLGERQERIDEDLQKAVGLKEDAEGILAAYEEAAAKARAEAQVVLRESSAAFAALATERHEALSRRIAEETTASEGRIEAAHADALANVEAIATEIAEAASARLIGVAPDRSATEASVAAVMGERG